MTERQRLVARQEEISKKIQETIEDPGAGTQKDTEEAKIKALDGRKKKTCMDSYKSFFAGAGKAFDEAEEVFWTRKVFRSEQPVWKNWKKPGMQQDQRHVGSSTS